MKSQTKKGEQQSIIEKPKASNRLGTLSNSLPDIVPKAPRIHICASEDTAKCHGHVELFPDSQNHKC